MIKEVAFSIDYSSQGGVGGCIMRRRSQLTFKVLFCNICFGTVGFLLLQSHWSRFWRRTKKGSSAWREINLIWSGKHTKKISRFVKFSARIFWPMVRKFPRRRQCSTKLCAVFCHRYLLRLCILLPLRRQHNQKICIDYAFVVDASHLPNLPVASVAYVDFYASLPLPRFWCIYTLCHFWCSSRYLTASTALLFRFPALSFSCPRCRF